MKRLRSIVTVGVMILSSLLMSNAALAAGTCSVGYTGPDSNNVCSITTTEACTVSNNNTVTIDNTNIQVSQSGNAGTGGNTSGGGSQTGSATNSNGTSINVTVTNGTCTVVRTVPATETSTPPKTSTTPKTHVTPQGRGQTKAALLPNTSGDSTPSVLLSLAAIVGVAVIISRLVVLAYSRYKA